MQSTSPTPHRVLCFGDSNTWGYIPATAAERYDAETRWPGVLQRQLGPDYTVIEAALNGRTTVWDDPMKPDRNGSKQLPVVLETHTPIDLVIIALGVNDLKHHFHLSAVDIALGAQTLAQTVLQSGAGRLQAGTRRSPDVLMMAPALPVACPQPMGHKFDGAPDRGAGIGQAFAEAAAELGCACLDADQVVTVPDTDGIHLDADGHAKLGSAVADLIKTLPIGNPSA